ncbi:PFL_4703 family integrating conjugative element protein [Zhongshania marina]|uniref:TIGR03746 family integrating conjugative element protein n=1 Tax=Zhongshania marina TaxID=2304603 RepID=A0A2S4HC68_9GAMM|nr:TIGR03746 family integrating conjugative element protein [Marortus luteolus]POP51560.1 TIGR03746 family integrating conjugative element protein [Marortus luteolus]
MRLKKALDGRDAHIKTLRYVIVGLAIICAFSFWGWKTAPEHIKVDIPPDLRTGSTRGIKERHPFNIYAFGLYIWQQMNNWPVEGLKDYPKRIESLACYLTPRFKAELERDYELRLRRHELSRTRAMQEMPDRPYTAKRVFIESADSWIAYYDVSVSEDFRGETVKDVFIRFPIRISRWDVDPECNLWGLALDGFYGQPARLEEAVQGEVAVEDPRDKEGL